VNASFSPDPERLAAARGAVRAYVERKRRWTRALFALACAAELSLFGAALAFFDPARREDWFVLVGLAFVYGPLVTFLLRNAVMLDRLYYRVRLEVAAGAGAEREGDEDDAGATRTFLAARERWARWLFVLTGAFEAVLFGAMVWLLDASRRHELFLLFGFLAVYTPLMITTWRNTFAIDRLYYRLVELLKYDLYDRVEAGAPATRDEAGEERRHGHNDA
jgi:hypothetical protein